MPSAATPVMFTDGGHRPLQDEIWNDDNTEENRLFLDDAAGAGRARGSLETAGAALTQDTRPVPKVSERLTPSSFILVP